MKQSKGSRNSGKAFKFLFNFKFLFVVLFSVVVVSLLSSVSYAGVKYHSLGDDATKIYVKEIKELPLDYKNYTFFYGPTVRFITGVPKEKNGYRLLIDPISYKTILKYKGYERVDISTDNKYMLVIHKNLTTLDLWDIKKKKIIKTFKLMDDFNRACCINTIRIYDKEHIIGLVNPEKGYNYVAIGDINNGEIKKVCEIKRKAIFDFKYYNENNIFYKVLENKVNKLYRLRLSNCSKKVILKGRDLFIDTTGQGYYRNKDGKIRIRVNNKIIDGEGHIIKIIPDVYKKWQQLCGVERVVEDSINGILVSPDDKLILSRIGETDVDFEYWVKGGKRCVVVYDFKGNISKLNLGLGDREVPDEIYWHPMGDRLIMRKINNEKTLTKLKIIILGRR